MHSHTGVDYNMLFLADIGELVLLVSGLFGGAGLGWILARKSERSRFQTRLIILILFVPPTAGVVHMSLLVLARWARWEYAKINSGLDIEFSLHPITVLWVGTATSIWWAATLLLSYVIRIKHLRIHRAGILLVV